MFFTNMNKHKIFFKIPYHVFRSPKFAWNQFYDARQTRQKQPQLVRFSRWNLTVPSGPPCTSLWHPKLRHLSPEPHLPWRSRPWELMRETAEWRFLMFYGHYLTFLIIRIMLKHVWFKIDLFTSIIILRFVDVCRYVVFAFSWYLSVIMETPSDNDFPFGSGW